MNPWRNVFVKPTSEPIARAASVPSALSSVPFCGSRMSSRVSRGHRHGYRGQPHLRKHAVDRQLIVLFATATSKRLVFTNA